MKERERAENKEEEDGWRTAGRGERWGGFLFFKNKNLTNHHFFILFQTNMLIVTYANLGVL